MLKIKTLNADIKRGVKTLNDKSYTYRGVTSYSLKFWSKVRGLVGQVVKAEFVEDYHGYKLFLTTDKGYRVGLFGCSFGYWGEGCRGSAQVLKDCGFTNAQIKKVFTKQSNFKLYKVRGEF
jgi:hypothetical protein